MGDLGACLKPGNRRGVERLAYIRDAFKSRLLEVPTHACIEGPSLYSVNRADDLGQLRGVFLLLLYDMNIPTTVVPPSSLKKFATGNGNASKERMVKSACKTFSLDVESDDIADALWLAQLAKGLCGDCPVTRKQMEVISGIRNPKTKRNVGSTRTPSI